MASRIPRQSYIALFIGATGSFLSNINGSSINVLLPTLSQYYGKGIGDMAILSLAFLLSQTISLFIVGRLCDAKNTRTVFLWGFGLYAVSTFFCVVAPTLELLAACRLMQGIATALITVCASVSIVRNVSLVRRGWAFGIMTLSASIGFAAGPSLAGILLEYFHWKMVFVLIFILGLIPFAYTWFFYKDKMKKRPFRVDTVGFACSSLAIGSLFGALITAARFGISCPVAWIFLSLMLIGLYAFIRRCSKAPDPLINMEILRNFKLLAALAGSMCNAICFSGIVFTLPFYFKFVRAFSDQQMGLMMMAAPLAGLVGSLLGGRVADKIGAKQGSLIACAVYLPVLLSITRFHQTTSPGVLTLLLGTFGLCYIFYWTSCTTMIMSWAKEGEEGKLSAIRLLLPLLGNAVGIALFALFFDNAETPTALQEAAILGSFHHAVWLACGVVTIQLLCTVAAKCGTASTESREHTWSDSLWSQG